MSRCANFHKLSVASVFSLKISVNSFTLAVTLSVFALSILSTLKDFEMKFKWSNLILIKYIKCQRLNYVSHFSHYKLTLTSSLSSAGESHYCLFISELMQLVMFIILHFWVQLVLYSRDELEFDRGKIFQQCRVKHRPGFNAATILVFLIKTMTHCFLIWKARLFSAVKQTAPLLLLIRLSRVIAPCYLHTGRNPMLNEQLHKFSGVKWVLRKKETRLWFEHDTSFMQFTTVTYNMAC